MQLELKHLAPYLPYNLQVEYKGEITTIDALDCSGDFFVGKNRMVSFIDLKNVKPMLRPLSSITKVEIVEINELSPCNIFINITNNGDVFIEYDECFNEAISIELIDSIEVVNWFFSKHFDVFNLIDRGLAIEKE